LFSGIRSAWDRQSAAIGRLFLFSSGYSILSTAFPIVVAAPRFISGAITLGTLMQTAQAFQQMAAALSWPIDNLPRVAEWRASVERVLKLQDALGKLCNGHTPDGAAITTVTDAGPDLDIDNLTITSPTGQVILDKFSATVRPGEKVLITGDPAASVHLFKVVAGLWPWGKGRISMPRNASFFFVPHRPYLPVGTLREAVSYPAPRQNFDTASIERALALSGLKGLIHRMEERETWENALSVTEQQRLGFARLLLHKPDWVFMEEATDALDPEAEVGIISMLAQELPGVTILTIGYHPGLAQLHDRVITPCERRRSHRRDIIPVRPSE
jgi:putative ATP-binding cassette transporter